ncbi:MAG: phosphoribosylformylglycinamidine cyclo-ligase [Clostridia bacterium]|jgi:phosphoribosylformylglycinamidine cyclo-ligase
MAISYKDAGVDVEAGYRAVELMKDYVSRTWNQNVIGGLGSFGSFYALNKDEMKQPVLVSGTDGVGTKLKIAFLLDKHDTIGIDCVAMCVNDIACQGAKPLFFLDYIAAGQVHPEKISQIVKGLADGCVEAGCALVGGETAEMPGFYPDDEYDLAGFAVGIVERDKIINGQNIQSGDVLIGLESSGLHSNGYSLVRKLLSVDRRKLEEYNEDLACTLGEELLKPTHIYVKMILDLLEKYRIKGIAHITGGGFIENIPRIIPAGLRARIRLGSWPIKPIFHILQRLGNIAEQDLFNTFNMGIGLVIAADSSKADEIVRSCRDFAFKAYIIGEVVPGGAGVELCP